MGEYFHNLGEVAFLKFKSPEDKRKYWEKSITWSQREATT